MSKREPSYKEAITEIEKIVAELEAENIDVDAVSEKVRKATGLIKLCKDKLRGAEEQVEKALKELEEQDRGDDEPF